MLILLLVERAGRVEMVDAVEKAVLLALAFALGLPLMVVVACHIGHDVQRPASELLTDRVDEGGDWGLLGQLSELVGQLSDTRSIFISRLGNEDHVAFHVASSLVVLSMGNFPRKVGYKEDGVGKEANGVVQDLGGREGLVATLVGQDPETGSEQALHKGVSGPKSSPDGGRGNVFGSHVVVEQVEGGGQRGNVASNVGEATSTGTLEAVLGDGIADVLDGVVRDLELVAVRVQQRAASVLNTGVLDGAQRRQRSARRRAGRRVERRDGRRVCRRGSHRVGGDIPLDYGVLGTGGGGHCGGGVVVVWWWWSVVR